MPGFSSYREAIDSGRAKKERDGHTRLLRMQRPNRNPEILRSLCCLDSPFVAPSAPCAKICEGQAEFLGPRTENYASYVTSASKKDE